MTAHDYFTELLERFIPGWRRDIIEDLHSNLKLIEFLRDPPMKGSVNRINILDETSGMCRGGRIAEKSIQLVYISGIPVLPLEHLMRHKLNISQGHLRVGCRKDWRDARRIKSFLKKQRFFHLAA